MAKTDVKLYSTDTYGKVTTTTVSDVNPDAPNNQLVQMGRLFNNLTQNTYGKTDRINTINCDTEGGGSKQTATITLAETTITLANLKSAITGNAVGRAKYVTMNYDGDGTPYAFVTNVDGIGVSTVTVQTGNRSLCIYGGGTNLDSLAVGFTVTVRADETDNYKAAEATFTVTA